MPDQDHRAGLFPALLKHWRGRRGLSQLDLALTAGVSSRHISFLETGRSSPSAAMVLRLATTLDVPLRHVNAMLEAAGHEAAYPEPSQGLPDDVTHALNLMKNHQEPFPLVVIDRTYDVVDLNQGALTLFASVAPAAFGDGRPNLARFLFEPAVIAALVNFETCAQALLWRIQREVLAEPDHGPLRDLMETLIAHPSVADDWRDADLSVASSPALIVHLRLDGRDLRFLTLVTAFQAPQSVLVDELRIETWFPQDAETAEHCRALVGG